jgi:hypothetical protein
VAVTVDRGVEYECRQGRVEMREGWVYVIPWVTVVPVNHKGTANRKGVYPVEGPEMLEMWFQCTPGKPGHHTDVEVSGVFKKIAFPHERKVAEPEFASVPFRVSLLLCRG